MDLLNFAVFAVALTIGLLQHLLDRGNATTALAAQRWWANTVLFAAHTAAVTLFAAAIAWLTRADATPTQGVLSIGTLPIAVQIPLFLLAQSFVQYWLHRAGHQMAVLWSLHRIHHTDTTLDATTGLRHHPFESMVDYIPALGLTLILTPSAAGILGFFLLGFAFALFTHINPAWVPARLDRALSSVIMTPRLHQLHHSTWQPETDTNYGNILVIWDRIFGTYLPAPDTPRAGFALGLDTFPAQKAQDPFLLIASPFLGPDLRDGTATRD
jgi:sterol desaturase/sphingolipid hydroxylase (fatty acid hydroxylase superfamily)